MFALAVTLTLTFAAAMLSMTLEDIARVAMELATQKEGMVRVVAIRQLSGDVRRYFQEKGHYPEDLDELAMESGFEYTRHYQGMHLCLGGIRGAWIDPASMSGAEEDDPAAVAIAAIDRRRFFDPVPSERDCRVIGYGDYWERPGWRVVDWQETTARYRDRQTLRQRRQMTRTLNKFAHYYNLTGEFPGPSGNLRADVGAPEARANGLPGVSCQGAYLWKNSILLDCADLFSVWGTDVHLYRRTARHIVLITSPSPAPDARSPYVSSELNPDIFRK